MILRRILRKVKETHWKYLATGSNVRVLGVLKTDASVTIKNTHIYVDALSSLILHGHVRLDGVRLWVLNGSRVEIGEYSFLERGNNVIVPEYIVNNGNLLVSDHSKLACQRLWIRFGGNIEIGQYTNINSGSEIRSDESVRIGSHCMLSYNLRIWDTNTHCIYPSEKRQRLTHEKFPNFGFEYERPKTMPVVIGDGVWIGEKSSVLKGTSLGDNVIVGYNTTLVGRQIPAGKTVVLKIELSIM